MKSRPTRATEALALLGAACVIAVSSAAARSGEGAAEPFTVTSTLDGKSVLPLRTRWLAHPDLPAKNVERVDFLIDGKLRWIERKTPYNYGGDDLKGHLGYLITTWRTPGRHTFTARATATDGRTATSTVTARVIAAPQPPPELAGKTWRKAGWKLIFDGVGAWHADPAGLGIANQYESTGQIIHVYAPIQMAPLINNHTTIRRYGMHDIGGMDCREDGPFGTYRWSVSGKELTLTATREACPTRRAIWEGAWLQAK